jgi:hypothetical protein
MNYNEYKNRIAILGPRTSALIYGYRVCVSPHEKKILFFCLFLYFSLFSPPLFLLLCC